MKIAITGATGQLGQLVIQHLLQRTAAENIIALVRNADKAQQLFDTGIQIRPFNYDQPETLAASLQGVDKLLLISANEIGRRTPQHSAVIQAAQTAHVPYIAYTSLLNADNSPLGLAKEHIETEKLIRDSGLSYTFLRNNWYSENYLAAVPQAIAQGTLYGAAADAKIKSATRSDYAEAAAVVLTTAGHEAKTYELAGTEGYTLTDLAAKISQVSGQKVQYQDLPATDYHAALVQAGLPEGLVDVIVDADVQAQQGALDSNSRDLEQLIGHPTTNLVDAIQAAL